MEKQGIVRPGVTPDTEAKIVVKSAGVGSPGPNRGGDAFTKAQSVELDDDARKRASDAVAQRLR